MEAALKKIFIIAGLLFCSSTSAYAVVLQWSVGDGGNDHYYEKVDESLPWTDAKTAAEGRTYLGVPGYLATMTSAEENAFLVSRFVTFTSWIGGFQFDKLDEPSGHWRWVTDEPWSYTKWFTPNEPNESGGPEDYLVFVGADRSDGSLEGQWNDWKVFGDFQPRRFGPVGYFVEYDPTVIPEPTSTFLFGSGLLALAFRRKFF